ncbi:putative ABC transporter substrate-binding protein [Actinoplanes missouriensis 431]|uniref:Putative ABC transporter substrate-binding protein n=1 Tax=Actinoplanes missouriensis (strain ATCC 14538 / DSM 43046 / CBS 188.64 / JCM 3121 / NBRC 102363 / NCIMB 12654 / NRRL B-3342 / UNCC 431) TaxID=512565 RepID=I0HAA4_ACTM4|nr:ABC transporter substrate-binding protein [Actinoplanes missouriensis]BAL89941.1 putative ABC transporter substrate-binding protein [Actinoplanes missouriensis 431]
MHRRALLTRILAVVSALSLAGALAACGGSEGAQGGSGDSSAAIIQVGSVYEPQNLDNTAGGGQGVTEALNGNVYEGLFRLTDTGAVEPLLAKDQKVSDDGLTYTFTLQPDVKFHSGKALTSADVKASIERVTAENSKSARKSNLAVIKSIATPDDATVAITLNSRSISFVYNLSYIWIVNASATDLTTKADGTGPYRLGDWKRGSTLSLTRFDGYWGTPAKNAGVVFHYFTDATALNNALLTNAVDIVTGEQSPDALAQFSGNSNYKVNDGKSTTKLLLAFNDKAAPFDKVAVRQAVSQAIDDKKLLTSVWGEYGTTIGSMVPPSDPWYEDLTSVNAYNVENAKKLLASAGLPNGFTFTLDTPSYDPHPTAATFIKSELAKVGITVNINTITADEWYTKVYQKRDFTATLQEHVNDRDVVWYGNPDFYWGYNNPQVTDLIDKAEQARTADEQTTLLKQANKIIAEEAASDWLYLYPQIVVASTKLTGYPVNGLNAQFFAYGIVKN